MARFMTIADAKAQLAAKGLIISKDTVGSGPTGSGEYRVTFRIVPGMTKSRAEELAFYTPDLEDALRTGMSMAAEMEGKA